MREQLPGATTISLYTKVPRIRRANPASWKPIGFILVLSQPTMRPNTQTRIVRSVSRRSQSEDTIAIFGHVLWSDDICDVIYSKECSNKS